ncbi:MAG: hypothetical protein WCP68_13795 [Enhydrobacter sp.]
MSPSKPPESSSPSCFAHEADDTYMGYASRAEILSLLEEIRTIAPATAQSVLRIREMLPRIRDDALHRELAELAKRLESGEIARE